MAGGSGSRFWPLSRRRNPKQVLAINGPNSLLQETVIRLNGLVPLERIFIVTNKQQMKVITPQLPELNESNYIVEPVARNTAPCIGLAAVHIRKIDPDGIMLVMPADHLINDTKRFQEVVHSGMELVEKHDPLVTIGIPPTRPEIGYGYIQFDPPEKDNPENVHRVKAFAEKPNQETAKLFVKSGDFYWNSGIFMWRAQRILEEMAENLPDQYKQLKLIEDALDSKDQQQVTDSRYKTIRSISIDYGIMEVTSSPTYMLTGDFGWSDVGSWDELYRIFSDGKNKNVSTGEVVLLDSNSNFIYSPTKLTAIIGLNNVLVVNTPSATLICPLDRAQEVKDVVEKLKQDKKLKYL